MVLKVQWYHVYMYHVLVIQSSSFGGSSGFGFKVKGGFSGDSGAAAGGGNNSGSNIGFNSGSGSAYKYFIIPKNIRLIVE
jgi:hypothetical protein